MIKYIIFDFGKVLGYPKTGMWFITPKFLDLINKNNIDINKVKDIISKNKYLVKDDLPIKNLEQEFKMFINFYAEVLNGLGLDSKIAEEIAKDKVYSNNEYLLYDDVKEQLSKISKKYTLIMLTDNFPSIIDYLKIEEIYDLFDKVYVSSICETFKKEEKFFNLVISDYGIKESEAIFIDDNESNLDIAKEQGLDVILMDRENKIEKSKYKIINSLNNI